MCKFKSNVRPALLFLLLVSALVVCLPTDSYAAVDNQSGCIAAGGTWNSQTGVANGGICTGLTTNQIEDAVPTGGGTPPSESAGGATNSCAGVQTSILSCGDSSGNQTAEQTGIWDILKLVVMIMTSGVGVLAVGGIVYGSILYASAGGSQEQVKKGMSVIKNTAIGLLLFASMFTIINFLIPGGILN